MKRSLFFSLMVLTIMLVAVFSCKKTQSSKTPASQAGLAAKTPADSNFVSFDVAQTAAKQIKNSHIVSAIIHKKAINTIDSLSAKEILDTLAVPDNINPSYYIFNYVGGGYAIISSDKRVEPVLAYNDSGYFPRSGNVSTGLVNWLVVNNKNMQLVRSNAALKAPRAVTALWAELTAVNKTSNKVIDVSQPPPPPCQPTYSSYIVGPLLQTQWGQGWPYNALCPVGLYDHDHFATGCVATAMAQIIYYWKYPAGYNYNVMPLDYTDNGNYELARLMANIGTSVEMDYTVGGSNPDYDVLDPPPSCSDALKNSFHYSSSDEAGYDYLKVIANLNAREPVLLAASTDLHTFLGFNTGYYKDGHEWVCDGYEQINYTWCPSNGSPGGGEGFLYLHMNWGWNESFNPNNSNGYYDFNYWNPVNGNVPENYLYNQSMSYNIRP